MNILVIGNGGREHALVWKIAQSKRVKKIYAAPGNAGTSEIAENIAIKADDLESLLSFAQANKVDLTVVGPEIPLAKGIVDLFEKNKLPIFGPNKAAAKIEASKSFSKNFMKKHKIPTADFKTFSDFDKAVIYLQEANYPIVIKADGLAAGKGVLIVQEYEEALEAITTIMKQGKFGSAGAEVVIEEFLEGQEVSLLAFVDGKSIVPMSTAQDYKKRYEDNCGPNTGGMGAYSPTKTIDEHTLYTACIDILDKSFKALKSEGIIFKGILYVGIMLTKDGPKVLEYNCRFGDPETQVLLPRLENDLIDILEACINQSLDEISISWIDKYAVCVVLASEGYPGDYTKGYKIEGLNQSELIFHAGTKLLDGKVITDGGRVLGVTALDSNLKLAMKKAYEIVEKINFKGKCFRKDIAKKDI